LVPIADDGDRDAITLLAWMLVNMGRAGEGTRYANQAFEFGAMLALVNYGPNLLGQGNRPDGIEWLRRAIAWGWPHDPLAYVQQVVQQGDPDAAFELLQLARTSRPQLAANAVERVLDSARSSLSEIADLKSASTHARDEAVAAIDADATHIEDERKRVEGLVDDVTKLVHGVAAEQLATEYAKHADETEKTARNFTWGAIVFGAVAVGISLYIALKGVASGHDAGSILSKGLLTLPVIALAGYFGGLAGSYRRMAWHWRHVELQIRTASPYIAPLEEAPRKAMVAALALRFFPGQALNPQSGDTEAATDTPSIVAALTGDSRPLGVPPSQTLP
jgi:hypothetical protein